MSNEAGLDFVSAVGVLRTYIDELGALSVRPAVYYTVQGVRILCEEMAKARAYSERAATLHGEAIWIRAQARAKILELEGRHQSAIDLIVVSDSHKYLNLSWAERDSVYRTKCLNTLAEVRRAKAQVILIEGLVEQVTILAVGIYRAHREVEAIVRTAELEARLASKL